MSCYKELCSNCWYCCPVTNWLVNLFFSLLFFFLAEKFLESVEGNQNYPLLLLTLLEKSQDNVIRVCAAVTFKNYIKRNWRIVSQDQMILALLCSMSKYALLMMSTGALSDYVFVPKGWRWTEQNLWSGPDSNQGKYCKLDVKQPGTDSETGTSSPVSVLKVFEGHHRIKSESRNSATPLPLLCVILHSWVMPLVSLEGKTSLKSGLIF